MSLKELFQVSKHLHEAGVLSMNKRNGDFILPYNRRKYYPLVDDKHLTKQLAIQNQIAVPELYTIIESQFQTHELDLHLGDRVDFVIKPAHGSGGEGIMIIKDRKNHKYRQINGEIITQNEVAHHISNILSGMYSLAGQADKAMIEYRVKFDPVFDSVSYQGVPDIRTIVFKGIPVMSMLRLPTRRSNGKANLHQGAIGVGIDLCAGVTQHGVWGNDRIDEHPDYGNSISGLNIPYWEQILQLSAGCRELVKMEYIGVDIVLDAQYGPLMLEINARPGLAIQIANQRGLTPLLENVKKLTSIPSSLTERVELARRISKN